MDPQFLSQLKAFLDLQDQGYEFADYALDMGYDRLREEKSAKLFDEDVERVSSGQRKTVSELQERTLIQPDNLRSLSDDNERIHIGSFLGPDEPKSYIGPIIRNSFRDSPELREFIGFLAEHRGISDEEMLNEWVDETSRKAEDERRLDLGSVSFHKLLVRHFLDRLPVTSNLLSNLEEMPYADVISSELRELFREAHYCYLNGLEASTAVLCGAILGEALRMKAETQQNPNLDEALWEGLTDGWLPQELYGMADDVRLMRNLAVHDFPKFSRQATDRKATILSNTRAVVSHLFAGQ